ncbi:MAG TPA: EamA family transporter [Bacteroidota bacterium]|nr:EamA family transporter [Bacteroidota bacterium]
MRAEKFLVFAGFVLITVIWGSTWLGIKIGLESVPPFFGVALRFTLAGTVLLLITLLRGVPMKHHRENFLLYLSLGFLSFGLPYELVYWGEARIPSGLTSILFAFYPFVVAIFSHLFLRNERLNIYKISGIVLGILGIIIIFWSDLRFEGDSMGGMIAILLSTFLQGISLIIVKRIGKHVDPLTMNCGGIWAGIPLMYVLAFAFEDFHAVHLDRQGVLAILYLAIVGTVIAFGVFYWLLKRVEAVYLALSSLVTPILAVILGTIFLDEQLSPNVFWGAALVLMGILVTNGKDLSRKVALAYSRNVNSKEGG